MTRENYQTTVGKRSLTPPPPHLKRVSASPVNLALLDNNDDNSNTCPCHNAPQLVESTSTMPPTTCQNQQQVSNTDRSHLKGQCQLQCIARSNNAWRPFYWQSNSCFGFQSVIYFNHPMVILAHFNRIVTTKHQRNVYNRYLLTFHHFQGKM